MSDSIDSLLESQPTTDQPQTEQPTEPQQPIKTDVDELIDIFSKYPTEDEARQALRDGLQGVGKDKRFSANGKTYSKANCYKAINRIKEDNGFSGEKKVAGKEPTAKVDDVPLTPFPTSDDDQTAYPSPSFGEAIENIGDLPPTPAPQPTPNTPTQRVFTEPSERICKSYAFIAKVLCNKLSQATNEPVLGMDDNEAKEVGYSLAVLTMDENGTVDPRWAAVGVLIASVLSRLIPMLPKIAKKLGAKKQGAA